MADTKTEDEETIEPTNTAPTPATPRLTGIAAIPPAGSRIGSGPNPLSKGQRKHLRRQKEALQIKVPSRRSQISR